MSTAFTRERDAKKAAKEAKAKAEKEAKNKQQQDKVIAEFNEKKAQADSAADPIGKLKAWCSKPPYLDLYQEVKRTTYIAVIESISALSKEQADAGLWNALELKEASILHKYINAAGNQIEAADE
mmetsp:Transcript_31218/g.38554  ORF Transcript_31218/g.38554 Transcript_31218/m.38554 type:complete len:125 (-) Transcript_31218:181-555(-)|eukprot:CAMPEP_0170452854 /NCGR_PEP_ID=MMETSP0123-20130129/1619_1 /TAXON_ID=182087 /ORGANISM="Favella ehrenbergii, Strain Fehren 1" /LENGTH=124 /DNA_ID=CAMNT_0010715009 /DNA_START=26 /DNA_END=400 /DNA_ORIENTATION=-